VAVETTKKNNHTAWNRILLVLLSILLVITSFVVILRDNFISSSKAYLFLKESQAFENLAELTKDSIRSNLPDKVKNNFIEKALIEKIMEIVVTPQNIAKIAEPAIVGLYKVTTKAADLADKNISYDTKTIKNQARQYIPSLGLPKSFVDASNEFVNAVPDEITVLDVQKNPNSPLAIFVKLRNAYRTINTVANILWIVLVINIVALIAINIKNIARMLKSFAWGFGSAGVASLIISYLAPQLTSLFMGSGSNATDQAISNLVNGLVQHYFKLMSSYGWLYIVISAIATAGYLITNSKRGQSVLHDGPKKIIAKLGLRK
jgi:hypothetical protein